MRITTTAICGSDLHLYDVLGPFISEGDILGHLLLWDIHRNIDTVPRGWTVLRFILTDVAGKGHNWWIVIADSRVDLCDFDPGHPLAVTVETDLRTLTTIWRGDLG